MWIKGCLRSTNFSILINGKPRGKIFAKRGIIPRDPLSPFLFTIMGDSLSRLIHFYREQRILRSSLIGHNEVEITHLQYADDIVIFCPNIKDNLERWWMFLNIILMGVGLSLNLDKTALLSSCTMPPPWVVRLRLFPLII